MTDYQQFRGRCKALSEAWVREHPDYTLVRGSYFCPMWNREEPHWWTKDAEGKIYDPSARQFPSAGSGIYTEFDGWVSCAECGRRVAEDEAGFYGNYAFCSDRCIGRFVGVL